MCIIEKSSLCCALRARRIALRRVAPRRVASRQQLRLRNAAAAGRLRCPKWPLGELVRKQTGRRRN